MMRWRLALWVLRSCPMCAAFGRALGGRIFRFAAAARDPYVATGVTAAVPVATGLAGNALAGRSVTGGVCDGAALGR